MMKEPSLSVLHRMKVHLPRIETHRQMLWVLHPADVSVQALGTDLYSNAFFLRLEMSYLDYIKKFISKS